MDGAAVGGPVVVGLGEFCCCASFGASSCSAYMPCDRSTLMARSLAREVGVLDMMECRADLFFVPMRFEAVGFML